MNDDGTNNDTDPETPLLVTVIKFGVVMVAIVGFVSLAAIIITAFGLVARMGRPHILLLAGMVIGLAVSLILEIVASEELPFGRIGLQLCNLTLGASIASWALGYIAYQNILIGQVGSGSAAAILPGLVETDWWRWLFPAQPGTSQATRDLLYEQQLFLMGVGIVSFIATLLSALIVRGIEEAEPSGWLFALLWTMAKPFNFFLGLVLFFIYIMLLVGGVES